MKYGLLDFDKTVNAYWDASWNAKALLNIGDAVEYMVVEQLYKKAGIDEKDIVRLSIPELISYRGETITVALNIALDSYVGYNRILSELSPDIIPIFLGMSITNPSLDEREIKCLKKFSPVGCRDERSYKYLKSLNIPCYLNGCTAAVVTLDNIIIPEVQDKILFIDVPYNVKEFVPSEVLQDIVFLNQEIYCRKNDQNEDFIPTDWAKDILSYYSSKPRMIVTSRFHGAVLAIANDIPALITLEKNTFRFSWLNNYYPIYTEETFDSIDWNVKKIDFSYERDLIFEVALKRIQGFKVDEDLLLRLTAMQLEKNNVNTLQSSNQVLYYRRVWNEIQKKWKCNEAYQYAFWGVNDNADELYSLISQEYPNAKLVDVYDLYKSIVYKEITSKNPAEIKNCISQNYYLIVTAYLASRVAEDICNPNGFPMENVFLCERDFIKPEDLLDK